MFKSLKIKLWKVVVKKKSNVRAVHRGKTEVSSLIELTTPKDAKINQ